MAAIENIVSVVHDRELVLAELNTLRDESPKFNFLPDEDELKEGLSWSEDRDYICGQLWKMENAFVNITIHYIFNRRDCIRFFSKNYFTDNCINICII